MKTTTLAALALLATSPALASPYSFVALPNGFTADAINNVGQIAGTAFVAGGSFAAPAILANGAVTLLAVPPNQQPPLEVEGINDGGTVLGLSTEGRSPFLLSNGVASGFAAPGNTSAGIQAYGLNDTGQVVGSALVSGSQGTAAVQGYLSSGSSYIVLTVQGAATDPRAIDNQGDVVGGYGSGGYGQTPEQGFLYAGGTTVTFTVPGSASTLPVAINNGGEIAGTYTTAAGTSGFTLQDGVFTTLAGPDGTAFLPVGLDNAGQLIGTFGGTGPSYLATPQPAATSVPEPGSAALLVTMLAPGLVLRRRGAANASRGTCRTTCP